MKILTRIHTALFIVLIAFFAMGFSCGGGGGGGGGAAGSGGADVSPDTLNAADVVSDTITEEEVTNESSSENNSPVIEPQANSAYEGNLDTGTTDSGGDTTNLDVILPEETANASSPDEQGSGTGSDSSVNTADNTGSDSGSTTIAENTNSGTEDSADQSDIAASGESKSDTNADTSKGSDTTTNVTTNPDEIIQEVAPEEVTTQKVPDYELITTEGKWYKETPGEITSGSAAAGAKNKIAELRKQIKEIIEQYAKKLITHKDALEKVKALRTQIAELRVNIGNGGNKVEGIYTYWASQNLFLNINKGDTGWYRLVVIAKNKGTLPDSYDRFTFNVTDGDGDIIGSFSVKASDKVYYKGSIDFKLEKPAGTRLNILWTNDYYIKDKYDANVNIKKVVLKRIKEPKTHLFKNRHLQGDQFSEMDGRWFFENQSAYTNWSGQEIGYKFENMEEGLYEVTIEAQNQGSLPLPKNYKEFNLDIESGYDSGNMSIAASEKKWEQGTITMNFPEGTTTLYLTWLNDSYKAGEYDANIMIKSISIKKVKESNLTAYLLKTKPGNKIFILAAFLVISGVLAGIYIKNRSASSES